MAKSSGRKRGKSDRARIIEWYEADVRRYLEMIGEYTEYNTLVTEELIERTQTRINKLKKQEEKWNDTIRGLTQQN